MSAASAGSDPLLDWINTICNPPIPNMDALRDCTFLKDIFFSFVPATLASELEDLLRGVTAKQTQELNAPILTSALTSYAENTNLLVTPPITKGVSWDSEDVIRDLTFNILICGLQSKKRKSLLTKMYSEMSPSSLEKLKKVLAPYRGDKLLDPLIDLRGIIVLAQNNPETPPPAASKPTSRNGKMQTISLEQFNVMNQGGSGKFNSWSPADAQKADSNYNNTYTEGMDLIGGRKGGRNRRSVKSVRWDMLPPPSNPDPLNPLGLDDFDDNSSMQGVDIGLSNELMTDAASNQLQTVNRSPAKNSITFTDPQHAMAEVTRTAQNLNQQPGAAGPQVNDLLDAVKSELTKKIIEEQSKSLDRKAPEVQSLVQIDSQLAQLQQKLKETQSKQTELRTSLQGQGISVPSQSVSTASSSQLADQTTTLIDELYLLVQKAPPPSATSENQSELSKQVISLLFEFLKAANTGGASLGSQAGDALAKVSSFALGIFVTLMMVYLAVSIISDMDLHDHTMLKPT